MIDLPRAALVPLAVTLLVAGADTLRAQRRGRGGGPRFRKTALLERFDKDQNGRLDTAERKAAREWLRENPRQQGFGRRGGRGPGGPGNEPEGEPAPVTHPILPGDVESHPKKRLYAPDVLRTFLLSFEQPDWFEELSAFYRTDVDVPATLIVDGKVFREVGVRLRGNSSYFGVRGRKKSLNLALDHAHRRQRLQGYKTLNLLNAHADPSFVRTVVFSQACREYLPAPKANLARVVINGESFGVYVNVQQLNRDFMRDWFGTRRGTRWKIPPNFGGDGALKYLGEDRARYEAAYELKTKGEKGALDRLIRLCRLLCETPGDELEATLPPVLDIDSALWFIAMDNAFLDGDGYISRGSDYALFEDERGRFHLVPYDNNEVLRAGGGGPGGFGGPPPGRPPPGGPPGFGRRGGGGGPGGFRGGGPEMSPLVHADNPDRPLIQRLLSVPAWRARYLAHLRTIVHDWLDWEKLGPVCQGHMDLIADEVALDDKSLYGYDRFDRSLSELRTLVEDRRKALLAHEALRGPWPEILSVEAEEVEGDAPWRSLRVRARLSDKAAQGVLHYTNQRGLPYRAVAMVSDGKGGFTARTPAFAPSTRLRYYVEARAPEGVGTTTFHPTKTEAAPLRHRLGKQ